MGQCPGTFSEWVDSACRGAQLGLTGRDGVADRAAGLAVPAYSNSTIPLLEAALETRSSR